MNFSELKTEFFARGTNYLEEDAQGIVRAEAWLNQGYREIINLHAWTFLHATANGAANAGTVSIPDLRRVLYVADSSTGNSPGRQLQYRSLADLVDMGVDLSEPGDPDYYWIDGGNVVKAYPVGGTLSARYIKRVPPMTGTDSPIFDEEYHNLIVDKAMVKAYIDGDNFEAAAALRAEIDLGLSAMAEDYMIETREPEYLDPTGYDI